MIRIIAIIIAFNILLSGWWLLKYWYDAKKERKDFLKKSLPAEDESDAFKIKYRMYFDEYTEDSFRTICKAIPNANRVNRYWIQNII